MLVQKTDRGWERAMVRSGLTMMVDLTKKTIRFMETGGAVQTDGSLRVSQLSTQMHDDPTVGLTAADRLGEPQPRSVHGLVNTAEDAWEFASLIGDFYGLVPVRDDRFTTSEDRPCFSFFTPEELGRISKRIEHIREESGNAQAGLREITTWK